MTLWTVADQAPLCKGFYRQKYWSELPCPPPRDLPDPGTKAASLSSPALASRFFITSAPVKPQILPFSSVQFSCSVMSNSWRPHRLQHTRLPCPSPIPRAYSNPCPLSQWCHPTISSSVIPFSSCLQSFPAWGSFQMSQFFASGGQSVGVSASASVLPMNIQDWYPLGWTGWISLLSKVYHSCFNPPLPPHHRLQHTRLPCPSPAPRACSVSCSLSQWGHGHESEQAVLIFKTTSMMFSIVTVTVYKGSLLSTSSPTLYSYLWKVAILTGMLWSNISLWFDLHFLDD